jgi:hypothetical protein
MGERSDLLHASAAAARPAPPRCCRSPRTRRRYAQPRARLVPRSASARRQHQEPLHSWAGLAAGRGRMKMGQDSISRCSFVRRRSRTFSCQVPAGICRSRPEPRNRRGRRQPASALSRQGDRRGPREHLVQSNCRPHSSTPAGRMAPTTKAGGSFAWESPEREAAWSSSDRMVRRRSRPTTTDGLADPHRLPKRQSAPVGDSR